MLLTKLFLSTKTNFTNLFQIPSFNKWGWIIRKLQVSRPPTGDSVLLAPIVIL